MDKPGCEAVALGRLPDDSVSDPARAREAREARVATGRVAASHLNGAALIRGDLSIGRWLAGQSRTRTSIFPALLPLNSPINASGALSKPSTIVS